MKKLKMILLFVAVICLAVSCSKSESYEDNDVELKFGKAEHMKVCLPFRLDLVGEYVFRAPDSTCGYDEENDRLIWRIIVDAEGNATHMGQVTASFNFCCKVPTGFYGPAEVIVQAANGDELYLSCQGQVIKGRAEDHPEYVTSYWRDPFVILGGTGRFKGASGGGMTDDYNCVGIDPYSHHHWTGTIILKKGRR